MRLDDLELLVGDAVDADDPEQPLRLLSKVIGLNLLELSVEDRLTVARICHQGAAKAQKPARVALLSLYTAIMAFAQQQEGARDRARAEQRRRSDAMVEGMRHFGQR